MVLRVTIPSFRKVKDGEDSYTVFVVDVWSSGRHHIIEKRYSEFEELHKQLKKIMKTPEFPPKKMLKFNAKVLEQRRLGLDTYFQGVLEYEQIPSFMHEFLETHLLDNTEIYENEKEEESSHQPVITMDSSVFLRVPDEKNLHCIITEGVLMGLYSSPVGEFIS